MQELHLVGFTTDRRHLIFSSRQGAKSGSFLVPVDEDLLEAVENLANAGGEGDATDEDFDEAIVAPAADNRVEAKLSVREVQARLRAGLAVDEVAARAEVDPAWVERFAQPIRAEQQQIVTRALSTRMERPRTGRSSLALRDAVSRAMAERDLVFTAESFAAAWSSRLVGADLWSVEFTFVHRGRRRTVSWTFEAAEGRLTTSDRLASQIGFSADGGAPTAGGRTPTGPDDAADRPASGRSRQSTRAATRRSSATRPPKKKTAAKKKSAATKTSAKKRATTKKRPSKKAAAKKTGTKKTGTKKTGTKKAAAPKRAAKRSTSRASLDAKQAAAAKRREAATAKKVAAARKAATRKMEQATAKRVAAAKKAAQRKAVADEKAAARAAREEAKQRTSDEKAASAAATIAAERRVAQDQAEAESSAARDREAARAVATAERKLAEERAAAARETTEREATERADADRVETERATASDSTTAVSEPAPAPPPETEPEAGPTPVRTPRAALADAASPRRPGPRTAAATGQRLTSPPGAPVARRPDQAVVRLRASHLPDMTEDPAARVAARRARAAERSVPTAQFRSGSATQAAAASVNGAGPTTSEGVRRIEPPGGAEAPDEAEPDTEAGADQVEDRPRPDRRRPRTRQLRAR